MIVDKKEFIKTFAQMLKSQLSAQPEDDVKAYIKNIDFDGYYKLYKREVAEEGKQHLPVTAFISSYTSSLFMLYPDY